MSYSDDHIKTILTRTKVVAVVGFSPNPARASHYVSQFWQQMGYRVIPVNPGQAGKIILGETVRDNLADISESVDLVDIFRRSEAVPAIVDVALTHLSGLSTIWMQLGVSHAVAAAKAEAAGVDVIENRCPKIEYPRLMGHQPIHDVRV